MMRKLGAGCETTLPTSDMTEKEVKRLEENRQTLLVIGLTVVLVGLLAVNAFTSIYSVVDDSPGIDMSSFDNEGGYIHMVDGQDIYVPKAKRLVDHLDYSEISVGKDTVYVKTYTSYDTYNCMYRYEHSYAIPKSSISYVSH